MDIKEQKLLLQTHPLNLLVSWGSRFASLYFVWNHKIGLTLFTMFVPAVLVSYFIVKYIDITALKDTAYGKLAHLLVSTKMEIVRAVGLAVAIVCALYHYSLAIIIGISIILLSWIVSVLDKPKVV